jgi:hypothetical protein
MATNYYQVIKIFGKYLEQNLPNTLQLCLEISISLNSRNLLQFLQFSYLYTVKEKGGKPDRKQYPLPHGLRNPYRNLKSENSQDYAQKPQQNCALMNSASLRNKYQPRRGVDTVDRTHGRQ